MTATSGRGTSTAARGDGLRCDRHRSAVVISGQQRVDELAPGLGFADVQRDEPPFRKAELSVGTEDVALNVREVEYDGHDEPQMPMTPGACVGSCRSSGLLAATNAANSS